MNIAVLGATGDVGSRVVCEALQRGHRVTAFVRSSRRAADIPEGVTIVVTEIGDAHTLEAALDGYDVVISALRPTEGKEETLPELTGAVLDAVAASGSRVLVVGGAARLLVPGEGGKTVLTTPGFLPPEIVPIATACQRQYERCLDETRVDWTYVSPAAMLQAGERTGQYRLGSDTLVTDSQGRSHISIEDFAVALIDEVEQPRHVRKAFTLGY
ncbi:NAD(P)H-binding protein [Halopseudomonas sp.]|uniref:NAD(P)-dependent oxidoreductase n=1 Tax=Halopseudomonas sp. TaxID=2901191 RepID=UPI00311DC336